MDFYQRLNKNNQSSIRSYMIAYFKRVEENDEFGEETPGDLRKTAALIATRSDLKEMSEMLIREADKFQEIVNAIQGEGD